MRRIILVALALFLIACSPGPAPTELRPAAVADASLPDAWLEGVDLAAYMDCAREQGVTLLQAHRAGDRPGAAENSLGAIEASLADGAVFIEIDVAPTADGVLVLMHDRSVERTTNGQGLVSEMRYAQFASLQLEDVEGRRLPEAPPTLAAALQAMDGRGIAQIDLKSLDMATIAEAIEAADAVDRSIVITPSINQAIELHDALPEVMFSVGIDSLADLERLVQAGVDPTRVQAWLGVGTGNPALDAALAEREIETSYGDFSGERDGTVDYRLLAANGAEVISVDDVPAAADVLAAHRQARELLASCETARLRD